MLYKIYYKLEDGKIDFFILNLTDVEQQMELIYKQCELRQGKFLKCDKVYLNKS